MNSAYHPPDMSQRIPGPAYSSSAPPPPIHTYQQHQHPPPPLPPPSQHHHSSHPPLPPPPSAPHPHHQHPPPPPPSHSLSSHQHHSQPPHHQSQLPPYAPAPYQQPQPSQYPRPHPHQQHAPSPSQHDEPPPPPPSSGPSPTDHQKDSEYVPPSYSKIEEGSGWKYSLDVKQQPVRARMCGFGDKDRRPITPPPCVRLVIINTETGKEVDYNSLDHAMFVLSVDLWNHDGTKEVNLVRSSTGTGAMASSSTYTYSSSQRPPEPLSAPQNAPSPDVVSISSSDEPMEEAGPLTVSPVFRHGQMDVTDMKLLWFYTSSTCTSFSVDQGPSNPINDVLRNRMVQVAFENPFLMDSLFGLASLHMQSLELSHDPARALTYRARSFEGYRLAVEKAQPETFPALLANSLLLTALSSQNFRDEDGKKLYLIDWMIVWRGIGLVIDLMGVEKLIDSGLYCLFNRPSVDVEQATNHIPACLVSMLNSIEPSDPDYLNVETYYETLQFLGSLYQNLHDGFGPTMMLRIITWFTFVPRNFVQLARELRPRALIILAYYAAFLKFPSDVWWIKNVGNRSLRDLCEHIGPEWQQYLLVPHMARLVEGELELGRVLFEDPNWSPQKPNSLRLDPTASITLVDEKGRRVKWIPAEKKLVLMDSRGQVITKGEAIEKWRTDMNSTFTFDP